ncbi:MAG TPA: AraC family transcriptional regulator [Thermoanaerobaculia bacterium]|nr:AraC family transcriptional regulator [Thermoanaerobaculia bacterium]
MRKRSSPVVSLNEDLEPQYENLADLGVDPALLQRSRSLRRLWRHVEGNIHRRVPLAEAAQIAGFERTYFSQYFHSRVGVTYSRWINAMRVSRAIDLLIHTHLTCAETCAAVGYRDVRTFQRNFKRLTGSTPTDFRESISKHPAPSGPVPAGLPTADQRAGTARTEASTHDSSSGRPRIALADSKATLADAACPGMPQSGSTAAPRRRAEGAWSRDGTT